MQELPRRQSVTVTSGGIEHRTPETIEDTLISRPFQGHDVLIAKQTHTDARSDPITQSLAEDVVPIRKLSEYIFHHGVPEKGGLRSLVWKLLLGYLPREKSQWASTLTTRRREYATFKKEVVANPYEKIYGHDSAAQRKPPQEDPLGVARQSGDGNEWDAFFKDGEIRAEITKDIKRTYSTFHFFNQRVNIHLEKVQAQARKEDMQPKKHPGGNLFDHAETKLSSWEDESATKRNHILDSLLGDSGSSSTTSAAKSVSSPLPSLSSLSHHTTSSSSAYFVSSSSSSSLASSVSSVSLPSVSDPDFFRKCKPFSLEDDRHHDVLARILFVYAKLNPGLRYVQGMNEILAPIYYVIATDPDLDFSFWAEPDSFFCFSSLMAEIRDRFIKSLDNTQTGVFSLLADFQKLLRLCDSELHSELTALKAEPAFYAFRWLSLLLSQEFNLPDVLRIWDTLFADSSRFDHLLFICVAMVIAVKPRILHEDFHTCLRTLQHYPEDIDLQEIFFLAQSLRERLAADNITISDLRRVE